METAENKKASRRKAPIDGQQPQKEWLSTREAAAFLDLDREELAAFAKSNGITPSTLMPGGKKFYYSVKEINAAMKRNRLFQQ